MIINGLIRYLFTSDSNRGPSVNHRPGVGYALPIIALVGGYYALSATYNMITGAGNSNKRTFSPKVLKANETFDAAYSSFSKEPKTPEGTSNKRNSLMRQMSPHERVPSPITHEGEPSPIKGGLKKDEGDIRGNGSSSPTKEVRFSPVDLVAKSHKKELHPHKAIAALIGGVFFKENPSINPKSQMVNSFIAFIAKYIESMYEGLKENSHPSNLDKILNTLKNDLESIIRDYNAVIDASRIQKENLNIEKDKEYVATVLSEEKLESLINISTFLVGDGITKEILKRFYNEHPAAFHDNKGILEFAMYIRQSIEDKYKECKTNPKIQSHDQAFRRIKNALPQIIYSHNLTLEKKPYNPLLSDEEYNSLIGISFNLLAGMEANAKKRQEENGTQ